MTDVEAVVLDCDGTLADTETISDQAWREALSDAGYEPGEDDFRAVIGHPYPRVFAYFAARVDLGEPEAFRDRVRTRFERLLEAGRVLHGDAEATLRGLAGEGVPVAVASSSSRRHVLRVLELGGVADLVQAVVGADDVERHKPHPEPFLVAACALGVPAGRCSAAEDTPIGVDAAVEAGMFTVGVLRPGFAADHLAGAHRIVTRLTPESLSPSSP